MTLDNAVKTEYNGNGMRVKLIVIYILNIIDLIATMLLVKRFGLEIEGNPIGKWLIETNLVWFVKVVGVGVALLGLWKLQGIKIAHTASTVILVVYSILVIYHGVIGSAVLSIM